MTDYIIRLSSGNSCRLQITHKMVGSPARHQPDAIRLAMDTGSALEPVVLDFLESKGLSITHRQHEVHVDGFPVRVGHIDGILQAVNDGSRELTDPDAKPGGVISLHPWVLSQMPEYILQVFENTGRVLIDVKCVNNDRWTQFQRRGFQADPMFIKNQYQLNNYLGALVLGGSTDGDGYGFSDITNYMLVAFNIDSRKFAFAYSEFNPKLFVESQRYYDEIGKAIRLNRLPDPDLDGSTPDCWFCDYAHLCPAAQAVKAERDKTIIQVMSEADEIRLDELAAEYLELKEQAEALDGAIKEIRSNLEVVLGPGGRIQTTRYRFSNASVAGRKAMDQGEVRKILEGLGMDVPTTQGSSYSRLTITPMYQQEATNE